MKKILLMICIFILTTGCVNIKKEDYKNIINNTITKNYNNKIYNRVGKGYKYYLPKYMNIKSSLNYNEKINSNDYTYYLYIDVISYYNNINYNFKENDNISYIFNYKDNNGYLNVKEIDNKYLVELLYNYAKIEVRVNKSDLNEAINKSIIILSTIKYDKKIIENLISENKLIGNEEILSIFENEVDKDNFMDVIEEYDKYEDESAIPDYDIINKED